MYVCISSNCQYRLRKHTSTSDVLADVIESVSEHLENLNKCAILSIDLQYIYNRSIDLKAFDTLDQIYY